MDVSELRAQLDEACEFPADHTDVIDRVGDVRLEAPTADTETVETALSRTQRTRYHSADDVVTTLLGTVGEAYVGRKHYDDRSGARTVASDRRVLSV